MSIASIRRAEVRDAAAIAHVHVQSWLTTYAGLVPQEYLASLSETERIPIWQHWLTRDVSIFVVESEGKVVGFACGGAIREPIAGYDAELYSIYLLKEGQGHGFGKDLLRTVGSDLIRRNYKSLLVWVLAQNPAVGFYEKTGAHHLTSKQIEIGGAQLPELALGWPDLTKTRVHLQG